MSNPPRLVETRVRHTNNGDCPKCEEILNRFAGCHPMLVDWFVQLQRKHPDAHISCAGRGRKDQEDAKKRGASKASYGESAHNYNMALDLFKMHQSGAEWPRDWFNEVVGKTLPGWLTWYGAPGSKFFELPHVEVTNWRSDQRKKLVE